jgi:hypothetical protein
MSPNMTRGALAVALALAVPAVAHADPSKAPARTYDYSGKVSDAEFKGTMTFVPASNGRFTVHATEKQEGKDDVSWSGDGTLVNYLMKIKRTSVVGMTEALGDSKKKDSLEYDILFEAGWKRGKVVVHKISVDDAGKSHRSELGTAIVSIKPEVWEAGELIVFTKDKIAELAQRGVEPGHEFDLVKDYVHVGVKAGVRMLSEGERSGWMRASDENFRAAHSKNPVEPCWVEITSSGTKAVGKDFSHDLNASGTLTFTPGFRYERGIRYTVVKQEDEKLSTIPGVTLQAGEGVVDALMGRPVLVYHLPLDAGKAEAMPTGEQRSFEGWSSLNLTGTLEYGPSFKSLFNGKEEIKFDGTAAITWNRTGTHKLFIEKQFGKWVHVKWTKSTEKDLGLAASAVFGLLHNQDEIDKLPLPQRVAYTAGVQKGEGYVTIAFNAGADWVRSQEFEVDMVFDLGDAGGRTGYEAAIKGDLATVESMAQSQAPGLKRWTRTDTASKSFETSVTLDAFNLLKYSHSSQSKTTTIVVQSLGGSSKTTTASATKADDSLFGHHHKELSTDSSYKEVTPKDGAASSALRFEFTFDRTDPKSSPADVADRLALARVLFPDAPAAPAGTKKIATETHLEIDLGTAAIARLLQVSDEAFIAAYGRACWGHAYAWSVARVNALADLDPTDSRNDGVHDEILRAIEAKDALSKLHKARALSSKPTEQVKKFRDLAKSEGYKLHAVVAFALATDRSDTRVALTISSGDQKLFDREEGQAQDLPENP